MFDGEVERAQTLRIDQPYSERAMLGIAIKQIMRDVRELLQRAQRYLLALGAERRCAMRLDRVAERLMSMAERIDVLRASMGMGVAEDEAIDADGSLRDSLKGLKQDIGTIRCQLGSMCAPQLSARMQRAFYRVSRVAAQTYACADKLQWEIEEREQRLSV